MKQFIILVVLTLTMFVSMAQSAMPDTTKQLFTKEDYLKKSKDSRTGALVSLIGGGTLFIIGGIISLNDLNNSLDNLFTTNTTENHDALAGVLVITGSLAMLGSIPLFRAAHKNKRMALSISFKNEPALQLQSSTVLYKSVPSFCLKIGL